VDVTLEASGQHLPGKTLNVSPYGAKVSLSGEPVPLAPGLNIGLRLTLPDGYLFLDAVVVRTDPDGVALNFDTLEAGQFQRLKGFVDTLLAQEWREILTELQGDQPVPSAVPSVDADVTPPQREDFPVVETVPISDRDVTPVELPPSPPPRSTGAQANGTAGQASVFARQRSDGATPPRLPVTPDADELETEKLRELLIRRGLGDLQLPEGPLTQQWREFLMRLEVQGR
jgi:hypothetical protein